jgi:outer membrane protein
MHTTSSKNTAKLRTLTALLAAACIAPSAMAQNAPASDSWQFTAGAGVVSKPLYPGSSETKTQALPLLNASYGRYFIGGVPSSGIPAGMGAYLVQDPHWKLGVGLGGSLGKQRKESDSSRLAGLGDISGTPQGAVFGSYSDTWWKVSGNVLTDIGGKKQGTRASMNLEANYSPMKNLVLTAGSGFTWTDAKYNQAFFGVDATQSARSGLPIYTPKAGINSVSFNLGANYQLTQQWGLGAIYSVSNLRGDAAISPITEKKSQSTFGMFASYRF